MHKITVHQLFQLGSKFDMTMISYTCFLEHEAKVKKLSEINAPLLTCVCNRQERCSQNIQLFISFKIYLLIYFFLFYLQNIEVLTNNLIFSWQTLGRPLEDSMHSSTVADFDEFCPKIMSPFASK